jgi:hypothetical protein
LSAEMSWWSIMEDDCTTSSERPRGQRTISAILRSKRLAAAEHLGSKLPS